MKEYIKTFMTPDEGDEYSIMDIPWMGHVDSTGQNLVCNKPDYKCVNDGDVLKVVKISTHNSFNESFNNSFD